MVFGVRCSWFVVCCVLFAGRCWLSLVRCMLSVVSCKMIALNWYVLGACGSLFVAMLPRCASCVAAVIC